LRIAFIVDALALVQKSDDRRFKHEVTNWETDLNRCASLLDVASVA